MTTEPRPTGPDSTADALRRIVIVGGGTAGWMAAAAFARFLGPRMTITLVESDAIGTVGVGEATIPGIRTFNAGLGIDEADFLRATGGSYKLGIEFVDWGVPGERYVHAFGEIGPSLGLIGFVPYWQRWRAAGGALDLWDFSAAALAARAGRFAPPQGATPLAWAYHFDASLYAAYLRRRAEGQGVVRREGRIVEVLRDGEGGDITAVRLDGGDTVAGDLFVDCSGFVGLLIERSLASGYEDWTHWLPCDRALAVPSERAAQIIPLTRSTAKVAGWQWRIPLQHRTGNGLVYASAHLSDEAAADTLMAGLDTPAIGDPRPIRFTTGMRRTQWSRNCVALGLAAGFVEPLESTSIHLIQQGIAELLRLMPATRDWAAERAQFNRRMRFEFESVRDFVMLHYHATRREGPLWEACRSMTLPDTLAARLDLYRSGGRVIRFDEELFSPVAWTQVLHGQGIAPRGWHPIANAASDAEVSAAMTRAAREAAALAASLPDHTAWLERLSVS
ncbi:tryptophan 7-halogenase [Roseomonas aeriglobus]|nr:tryptophan 7-halogenase [Roseomonas aeriglobus]